MTTLHDRVDGGLQDVLHDPRTAGHVPPGHDPLHGLTPQQYFDMWGDAHQTYHDGSPKWDWAKHAPNNGALPGTGKPSVLSVGERFDRYGSPRGTYVSPDGTPYRARGLPADSIGGGYHVYEVVKPMPVQESIVAPAFGETGRGTQFMLEHNVTWYLNQGYIVEVFS